MLLTSPPGISSISVADLLRDTSSRADIAARIERIIGDEAIARRLANTVVNRCRNIRYSAEFHLEFEMDDAWSDAEWESACAAFSASLTDHVQALSTLAYEAVVSAFMLGLKAGAEAHRNSLGD